jgi:hypothetical protein
MSLLKLIVFDAEDLNVVSAHLQDAILRSGDMAYLTRQKRFAAVLNRFDWAGAMKGEPANDDLTRFRCGLRFERVLKVRSSGINTADKGQVLVLLNMDFQPHGVDDPAGTVTLTFAGQAALQLDVECLEAELKDLGPAWAAKSKPQHPIDETD